MTDQARMNLYEFIEASGGLRDGARFAWGSVTWTVRKPALPCKVYFDAIVNDDTLDEVDLGICASLPALGWRALREGT